MQADLCIADLLLFLRTTAQATWQEDIARDVRLSSKPYSHRSFAEL